MDRATTSTVRTLSTGSIKILLDASIAAAEAQGISINAAVFDASGQMAGFLRMNEAHVGAADIAIDKAWTAVAFGGKLTREIGEAVETYPELIQGALLARPRYTCLTGGVPVYIDGALVGSVGVAGAAPDQDELCAQAGFEAIGATASA